jgi:hypothetical protein
MGVDFVLSVIPVVDQVSDARDLTAHIYRLGFRGEYNQWTRWVGLVFTLIGLIPEAGSVIKSASKVVFRGIETALEHIGDLLRLVRRIAPEVGEIGALQRWIRHNWGRAAEFGAEAWALLLTRGSELIARIPKAFAAMRRRVEGVLATLRRVGSEMLPRAFESVRKTVDEILEKVRARLSRRGTEAAEEMELESALDTQRRLTGEANPSWETRPRQTTPLPEKTRIESPQKSLGYDKPSSGEYSRARPKLQTALDFLVSLSNPEKHHFWPMYLQGLKNQTLKALPRDLHHVIHEALDAWKGGLFRRKAGKQFYETMSPAAILEELREFYSKNFPEYLPDLEQAAAETLAAIGKAIP